ncbi:MAG: hypothetical protein WA820_05840 [Bradyrhizobium sp.]
MNESTYEIRQRQNRPVDTLIVIRHAEDEVALGQAKDFGIVFQRFARIDADDLAMIALKIFQQRLFLGVAGIVANDNLNSRAGPRARLRDSRGSHRTVPVCRKQD